MKFTTSTKAYFEYTFKYKGLKYWLSNDYTLLTNTILDVIF